MLDKSGSTLMVSKEDNLPQTAQSSAATMESSGVGQGSLGGLLNSTPTPLHSASLLTDRNYLLAKGSFIDCVLQTKLDTTVPGMTSCVVTRTIYSDNGKVVLIERGSTVSGEYQATIKQGQARIFVLWNRIKTPSGVAINLDSPGTDSLGGSGLPGYVDNHFWQRFGGAILLSLVQDVTAAATNQMDPNSTTITFNNTSDASQSLAIEALRNTIHIPPTLYKNQGERIGIYVARDLDFKGVYDLKLDI
jgi:type IV secretion system protein VirB10